MGSDRDGWCRNNSQPAVMAMQAHSAPLGITFFNHSRASSSECGPDSGGFPAAFDGDAFVAYHGSWNRDEPTGQKVVRIAMGDDGMPSGEQPVDVLWHAGEGARWPSGLRPVDLKFVSCTI